MDRIKYIFLSIIVVLCLAGTPFEQMDSNNDGKLAVDEFRGPRPAFAKLDLNHDGFITKAEAVGTRLLNEGKGAMKKTPRKGRIEKKEIPNENVKQNETNNISELKYIDTHNHLIGIYMNRKTQQADYLGASEVAIEAMNQCGVKINILMPTPQTVSQEGMYTAEELFALLEKYPDRFKLLAGGGSLNRMIQETVVAGKVTETDINRFEKRGEMLINAGAIGFGEMAAEHFSFNERHPYLSVAPNHPLFLKLSDMAAKYNVPIDFHMEAIPEDMPMPDGFQTPPNPDMLKGNMKQFEELLDYNKNTKILWVHLGWDNTGFRTPETTRAILKRHKNLFMSIRIPVKLHLKTTPERSKILDENGNVKEEWLSVFEEFPERFVIGSDEFFMTPKGKKSKHGSTGSMNNTTMFLSKLPPELADKIGFQNAINIYNLNK